MYPPKKNDLYGNMYTSEIPNPLYNDKNPPSCIVFLQTSIKPLYCLTFLFPKSVDNLVLAKSKGYIYIIKLIIL
jgi:hypothetical protein